MSVVPTNPSHPTNTINTTGSVSSSAPPPTPDDKPAAPQPSEPKVTLGSDPQPLREVPAIDQGAVYSYCKDVHGNVVAFKLLSETLDVATRRRLGLGQQAYDPDLDNLVDGIMTNFGAELFSTPPDMTGRQRRAAELTALRTAATNHNYVGQLFNDTVAVRAEQYARETDDWATAIDDAAASNKTDLAGQAAKTAIQQLQAKQAALATLRKQQSDRQVSGKLDDARGDLQSVINALQAENQYLRTRLDGLNPGSPPSSVATSSGSSSTGHHSSKAAVATPAAPATPSASSDRRTPKR